MLERVIIVPDVDNAGVSLKRERGFIEETLLSIAGGFTADRVRGAWKDERGKTYRDRSTRYTLVLTPEQDKEIEQRLPWWTANLRQEALFTSRREVDVTFVTIEKQAA